MSQDSDSKSKPPQRKGGKSSHSLAATPTLKLVVSNPDPVQAASVPSQPTPSKAGFAAKVCSIGTHVYEMIIRDPFHELGCDLILDIEESRGKTVAVCHFPVILNESNGFLDEDEDLYGTIMLRFQMKVLEQLFLFCGKHNASQLTIYMDDAQAEGFGVYDDFLSYYDETITENGEKTEMVIRTDRETFDKWLGFMAEMTIKVEQDLWREQRTNSVIRNYLKFRPLA
jgi:hypothetical protein